MSESQADPCQALVDAVAACQAALTAAQLALALCRACNVPPSPEPIGGK